MLPHLGFLNTVTMNIHTQFSCEHIFSVLGVYTFQNHLATLCLPCFLQSSYIRLCSYLPCMRFQFFHILLKLSVFLNVVILVSIMEFLSFCLSACPTLACSSTPSLVLEPTSLRSQHIQNTCWNIKPCRMSNYSILGLSIYS